MNEPSWSHNLSARFRQKKKNGYTSLKKFRAGLMDEKTLLTRYVVEYWLGRVATVNLFNNVLIWGIDMEDPLSKNLPRRDDHRLWWASRVQGYWHIRLVCPYLLLRLINWRTKMVKLLFPLLKSAVWRWRLTSINLTLSKSISIPTDKIFDFAGFMVGWAGPLSLLPPKAIAMAEKDGASQQQQAVQAQIPRLDVCAEVRA